MSGKTTKLDVKPEFYKMMADRLHEQGWDSVRHFTLSNQRTLGLSTETTRRVFVKCDYKGLEPYTIANVMLHLNFTRAEIRTALKVSTTDDLMWRLIGDEDERLHLAPHENALIDMLRVVARHDTNIYNTVQSLVSSVASAHRVDVSEYSRRITKATAKARKG